MLRSNFCEFSDAYISVTSPNNAKTNKAAAFKYKGPSINCISKINGVQIDNAEDLDIVIAM